MQPSRIRQGTDVALKITERRTAKEARYLPTGIYLRRARYMKLQYIGPKNVFVAVSVT